MICYSEYSSPIGKLTLASNGESIIGLHIDGQKYFLGKVTEPISYNDELEVFAKAKAWLRRYFAGQRPAISELPLNPVGTGFGKTVWKLLCGIPYGEVVTYGDLAKKAAAELGKEKMSAQAIGGAVGHNPISIIIPCHRVVGAGGNLTGYDGGIDLKIRLLTHEGVSMENYFIPSQLN